MGSNIFTGTGDCNTDIFEGGRYSVYHTDDGYFVCFATDWPQRLTSIPSKRDCYHYFEILDVKKFIGLQSVAVIKYTSILLIHIGQWKGSRVVRLFKYKFTAMNSSLITEMSLKFVVSCYVNKISHWWDSQIRRLMVTNSWSGMTYGHFGRNIWYKKVMFVIFMEAKSRCSFKNFKRFWGKFYLSSIVNIFPNILHFIFHHYYI